MSNRDRIAHAAAEARAAAEEKLAKKKAAGAAKGRAKPPSKDVRMKIVWSVYNASGKPVQSFPYAEKAAAQMAATRLSSSTGHPHEVRATKVPMN